VGVTSVRNEDSKVGGQAVIEGVMMKSPFGSAVAVRMPDGSILARHLHMTRLSDRGDIWKKPVFRGAATLIDTLRLGLKALNWSAEAADSREKPRKGGSYVSALSTAAAMIMAVTLFAWLPLQMAKLLLPDGNAPLEQFYLHLLAGGFRLTAFLLYIWVISFLPDVKRLFTYHGAEHQTIHAFEKGLEPLDSEAALQSPLHQRCGTSFLLLVMLATVFFYAIIDSVIILLVGVNPSALVRILYHIPMIPFVMGFSYEILRIADRHLETSRLARLITAPGLLLQRLTTRKADLAEVEVAIASLRISLGEDPGPDVTMQDENRETGEEE
jgi:uncharacterized protein YqhQ